MDSDAHLQAQEEVGLPIDVNTGTYNYGNDDIMTQGLIEPLVFRRSYIQGTNLKEFFRSNTGTFGLGWTHNFNSHIATFLDFNSTSEIFLTGNNNPNNIDSIEEHARNLRLRIIQYINAYNAYHGYLPEDPEYLTIDAVLDMLATIADGGTATSNHSQMIGDNNCNNQSIPCFNIAEQIVPFTLDFTPYKIFTARTGSIHTLLMDGEPVNGVQKWKFESGFLAQAEEYLSSNGITLYHNGIPVVQNVQMRVILRNQTVQYYNDKGQLVAIGQRHEGTETVFSGDLPVSQELLHPTLLHYEPYGTENRTRLWQIESGTNALRFEYMANDPQFTSDLRIIAIHEYVNGVATGRSVQYGYTPPSGQQETGGLGEFYESMLKSFTDLRGEPWTYEYVGIYGEPNYDELPEGANRLIISIPYPRLAVVRNPLGQITEETTFCSYDILAAITDFFGLNPNYMREVRYDRYNTNPNSNSIITTAPKDCTAGRAYKQYNGAGELTLQIDYSFKDIVPHNMVMVTDGIGYVRRYTYENGVISSIEQSLQQRIWSVSESTWVAWTSSGWRPQSTAGFASGATWIPLETTTYDNNYRPLTQTDERDNTSTYLWSPNGDNFVRETVSGNLMGSVITGTNIYNDAFNRVETSVDALNRVTTYQYHPTIFTLPIEISQTRVDIEGQPASNDTITSTYTYTSDGLLDTMITDDNMVTCYQYNLQKQRTVIIVNCGSSPSYITEFMYDRSGRLVGVQAPDGTVTAMLYDGSSNVIRMIQNYTGTLDGDSDYLVSDAEMSAVANFDCQNSQGNSSNICTQYAYDQAGRLTHSIDSLNRATQYYYDAVGRVVYEVLNDTYSDEQTTFTPPSSTSPTTNVWTQYQYDVRGNVIAVIIPTDSGNRTDRICYDEQSRVAGYVQNYVPIGSQNPCTWQITQPSLNNDTNLVTRYQYNLGTQKEVAQLVTDPLGRKTLYCADALNRTTRVIENVTSGYLIASELNTICEKTRNEIATTTDTNRVSDIVYDSGEYPTNSRPHRSHNTLLL